MSNHTTWHSRGGWQLRAWGGGTSMEIAHEDGRSVFVQGDDASEMIEQWEALERMQSEEDTGVLLARLFDMWS